jgi:acyl carrier protein
MKGSLDNALKTDLKRLIIDACDLDAEAVDIDDDGPLFGRGSQLGLDSIDALQISIAVQKYGVKITDSKQMRRVMASINTFADFIRPE